MIALNIVLMTAVIVGIVSLLGWAIVADRRSDRTAGGGLSPTQAPLHRDLTMPRELRVHHGRQHAPRGRRTAMSSSVV